MYMMWHFWTQVSRVAETQAEKKAVAAAEATADKYLGRLPSPKSSVEFERACKALAKKPDLLANYVEVRECFGLLLYDASVCWRGFFASGSRNRGLHVVFTLVRVIQLNPYQGLFLIPWLGFSDLWV